VACDVGAKWSDDPELVRKRFDNLRDSAINMERKVNSLLELSRLDQGTVVVQKSRTSVSEIVEACWARLCEDNVLPVSQLENNIDRDITVETDAVKLDMIIHNFINNAVSYSDPGSAVTCSAETLSAGGCIIRISNHAADMNPDDLKHIFERFWRGDTARTEGCHSGLGLSIVKALADVLDIHIKVDLTEEGVFTAGMVFKQE
jgi:signal transduction histidine kinase